MADISARASKRDLFFFRQQNRNRLYEKVISFFAMKAEHDGLTKKDLADILGKDPAQITRLLASPGNWESDTVSDLMFACGGDLDYIVRDVRDLGARNEVPQMVAFLERYDHTLTHAPAPTSMFVFTESVPHRISLPTAVGGSSSRAR